MKFGLFDEQSVPRPWTRGTDRPRIRFVVDPEVPVVQGTRRIR